MSEKMGTTGKFPDGKIDDSDEGELQFKVGATKDGLVRIDFGKPVVWLAVFPDQAEAIAHSLLKHAADVRRAAQ